MAMTTIVVEGFGGILLGGKTSNGGVKRTRGDDEKTSDNGGRCLQWYCAPDSWMRQQAEEDTKTSGKREGADGEWHVKTDEESNTTSLTIFPPAKKDFWRKTYYDPLLVKDDGPFLYTALPLKSGDGSYLHYTVETSFALTARCQFDQAGLFVRLSPKHWLKTGIEVVDGRARLSCVVTNVFSDWSTQRWPSATKAVNAAPDSSSSSVLVHCDIRIHCRGTSFVVEAKGSKFDGETTCPDWEFMRIAHLSISSTNDLDTCTNDGWLGPSPVPGEMWAGVFACCPEDQQGGNAVFSKFKVQTGSSFEHNADGNAE